MASTRYLRRAFRASSSTTPSAAPPSGRDASAMHRSPTASSASRSSRAAPIASSARAVLEELGELDFDGYAIGGLAIGEDRALMFETTDWLAPELRPRKARYFMGIGDPEGILETIEAGVDMFDCVLPTRTARTGSALTWEGRLNLRNARFARENRGRSTPTATARRARPSRAHTSGTS